MTKRVILCVDGQSLRNPAMVGLAGEPIDALPWLECATDAQECRRAAKSLPEIEEAWVVSCDDMEPINVAAAIKRDDPCKKVFIVSCGQSGSMASRIASAGIDGVWPESQFLRRFAQVKQSCASKAPSDALSSEAGRECPTSEAPAGSNAVLNAPPSQGVCAPGFSPATSVRAEPTVASSPVAEASKQASVIAVVSGSGGCGKSTIAALFALLASRGGLSAIAVDADLQFGDLHYLLGASNPLRIEEAVEEPSRLMRLRDDARKGVALLAAPRKLEMSEEVAPHMPGIFAELKRCCDVIVVNTGAFWSDVQAMVLEVADAAVFAMDCRPSSLRATTHAVELCARLGVATTGFMFAVNRHEKTSLLSAMDVSCALRGAHAVELPYGGRDVDELLGSGYAGELLESRNPFAETVEELLMKVLPAEKREALERASEKRPKRRRAFFGKG